MLLVADAGPILSFAQAGHFDLLRDVVGALTVPEAVYAEIVLQGAGKPGAEDVWQAVWIRREAVTDRTFVDQLSAKLHRGEREALALAREHSGVILTDEHEA
jgi:predicted nucleic acid-binding protein